MSNDNIRTNENVIPEMVKAILEKQDISDGFPIPFEGYDYADPGC